MRISDRVFGAVVILGALIYGMSALNIQQPFFSDPLGPRSFPIGVAVVAAICGLVMVFAPDAEPDWPEMRSLLAIVFSTLLLIAYAYTLRPIGFLIPTAVASAVISFQITPTPKRAALFGLAISVGLFILFRHMLGLGLRGFGPMIETYLPFLLPIETAIDWAAQFITARGSAIVDLFMGGDPAPVAE